MAKVRKKKSSSKKRTKTSPKGRQTLSQKAPISLCMIVKNEEKFLFDCLKSVENLVSEMIIVDTGSQDSTLKIASQFDAKCYSIKWEKDFAKARNYGLEKSTKPWILYLDADERLHSQYHERVKNAINAYKADAFYIQVRSEVSGKLGNVPHTQAYPRLFRKIPGVKFEGRIHEQITPSITHLKGKFALLDAQIEHLGYSLSDEEMEIKIQRNLKSLLEQVDDEPENSYAKFQLGQTYILAEDIEKGKEYLQLALDEATLSPPLAATAMLILANEELKTDQCSTALVWIQKAIEIAPRQRLGWFLLSECYAKQKNYKEAINALEKYQQFKDLPFTDISIDKIIDPYLVSQRIGLYYFDLKLYSQAVEYLGLYFAFNPKILRKNILLKFIYALQQVHVPGSQFGAAFKGIIKDLEKFDYVEDAVTLLASFFDSQGNVILKEAVFRQACSIFPEKAVYCYYLGNTFLAQKNYNEAEKFFSRALKLDGEAYETHYNLAVTAIKQKQYKKAILWFERIKEKFPQHQALANRRLAGLYMKLGDAEKAGHYAFAPTLMTS